MPHLSHCWGARVCTSPSQGWPALPGVATTFQALVQVVTGKLGSRECGFPKKCTFLSSPHNIAHGSQASCISGSPGKLFILFSLSKGSKGSRWARLWLNPI